MTALDLAYRIVLESRITDLKAYRRWCRVQPNPARYADLAAEYTAELRSLLRLKRLARGVARTAREAEAALADGDHFARNTVTAGDQEPAVAVPGWFTDRTA